MTAKRTYTALIVLKVAFLTLCLITVLHGDHPPAVAQAAPTVRREYVPVITTQDALQNMSIDQINEHLKATDARTLKDHEVDAKAIADDHDAINGLLVEQRTLVGILGLLQGGGLILQLRRKAQA